MVIGRAGAALVGLLAAMTALGPVPAMAACAPQRTWLTAGHAITTGDLVRMRDIGNPDSSLIDMPSPLALSPDGRWLAFVQSEADPQSNRYCRQLLVLDLRTDTVRAIDAGGEPITVSFELRGLLAQNGGLATVTPGWAPDGRHVGYLRRDHGITQLWIAAADGSGARAVTDAPVDIEQWTWNDAMSVVVASRPGLVTQRLADDVEGRVGWLYDARFSPQIVGRPQPSGTHPLAFSSIDLRSGLSRGASPDDVSLLKDGGVGASSGALAIVRPDGARAWLAADDPAPFSPAQLRFAGADGRVVRCTSQACGDGILRLYWSADRGSVIILRREGWAKRDLAFYRWVPGDAAPVRLSRTTDVLLGCLSSGARFICLREGSTAPRRIVDLDPATGASRTIYDPNPEFATFRLGKVERLSWTNERGLPAWGDLVLPPGQHRGRLPLVVVQYHSDGFLRGGTGDENPIFPLAARGFAVLSVEAPPTVATLAPRFDNWDAVNRYGLAGWADRRSQLSSLAVAIAKLEARGLIDPSRVGISGVSDGATGARFALINSRLFAAAVISASSLEPKTVMTYGGPAWAEFNRSLGYPPASRDDPKFWQPASLALNAGTVHTPLLIQASDDEYVLALETYTALKEAGSPVEMFVFPNEHHLKWQPAHRLAIYERTIDWFAFWLNRTINPDPAKAQQYARWNELARAIPKSNRARP